MRDILGLFRQIAQLYLKIADKMTGSIGECLPKKGGYMLSGAGPITPTSPSNPNNQAGISGAQEETGLSLVSPVSSDGTYQAVGGSPGHLLAGPDGAGRLAAFYRTGPFVSSFSELASIRKIMDDIEGGRITTSKALSERIREEIFKEHERYQIDFTKAAAELLMWSKDKISFDVIDYVKDLVFLNSQRARIIQRTVSFHAFERRSDITTAIIKALSIVERELYGTGAARRFEEGQGINYGDFVWWRINAWEGADEAHDPVLLSIRLVSKVYSLYFDSGHYEVEPLERMNDAIRFASLGHGPQLRKGTSYPYIIHPLGAATIIAENGGDIDQIIAGLMHDLPEDTKVTVADIRAKFGDRVANALEAVVTPGKSAGKSKLSWEESKQLTIDHIGKLPLDGLIVEMADKLDNMRAIRADFEALGDGVWARFKRGKDQQGWYYRSLAAAFSKRTDTKGTINIAREFAQHVEAVFGGKTSSSSPVDPTPAPQTPPAGTPPVQASSGSSGGSAALMSGMIQPGAMGLSTMPIGAQMFMPFMGMPAMSVAPVLV